ncbi:MAG: hypothetical protein ACK4M7_10535, partial [Burkholderiales bacterium]
MSCYHPTILERGVEQPLSTELPGVDSHQAQSSYLVDLIKDPALLINGDGQDQKNLSTRSLEATAEEAELTYRFIDTYRFRQKGPSVEVLIGLAANPRFLKIDEEIQQSLPAASRALCGLDQVKWLLGHGYY